MNLFNADNMFFRGLGKLVDGVWLSLLFLFSCIPIITIGCALTSLYYAVHKSLRHDRGYVGQEYRLAFRSNFKQATPIWIGILLAAGLLFVDIKLLANTGGGTGYDYSGLTLAFKFMILALAVWSLYLFPYMARFEDSRKDSMRNTAYMLILHCPSTLLLFLNLAIFALIVAAFFPFPVFILVPAFYTLVQNRILEKVFYKRMSEEQRKKEKERYY
ncbi:hypothetical protein FACS1894111_08810 [Clostridia bacterium]|nr:hypothetical protein FACS1894111_08810 [Clostridia bacterium]